MHACLRLTIECIRDLLSAYTDCIIVMVLFYCVLHKLCVSAKHVECCGNFYLLLASYISDCLK